MPNAIDTHEPGCMCPECGRQPTAEELRKLRNPGHQQVPNAIDTLREAAAEAQGADFDAGRKDARERFAVRDAALADVEALLQAAEYTVRLNTYLSNGQVDPLYRPLAAAVRKVKGEA